jgi:alginate O-acetyltransferase complex protein AlgI
MLFNSVEFILMFLPVVIAGYFVLGARSRNLACVWLVAASLFFYGWWDTRYLALLGISIVGNFTLGRAISASALSTQRSRKHLLIAGVVVNLLLLAYYKYANFFAGNLAALAGIELNLREIVLPLGISFFTFTQIAFLVDCWKSDVREYRFVHYALFVTYFPHLIAGPILHHAEMMPQFANSRVYRPHWRDISAGLVFFSLGLFKKVVVADGIASFVSPVFAAVALGHQPHLLEASGAAFGYALQIYFDFSGYSDMAIGLSRLFGIHLPLNFNSPYKASNIIEFWRRWHMTLSRFLRDYLYIPLGGNRNGHQARYLNLMITMVLGGLWHGAAWTFVLWGAGHGILLALNHAFHALRQRDPWRRLFPTALPKWLGVVITFNLVVLLWVFFRAADVPAALSMIKGMFGGNGVVLPDAWRQGEGFVAGFLQQQGFAFGGESAFLVRTPFSWIFWSLLVVFLLPNSQETVARVEAWLATGQTGVWTRSRTVGLGVLFGWLCWLSLSKIDKGSEFLYFQF